jgi:N-acetyl-ornithine/N-acetyl-lysine deacetylase
VQRLRAIQSPLIREVRGSGLLIGIELKEKVQPYLEQLIERGILALPAGPRVLRLLPPLVITHEQLSYAIDVIAEILGDTRISANVATELASVEGGVTVVGEESDGLRPEVALLQEALRIPGYSGEEGAIACYLVAQARALGLEAHLDNVGNFIAAACPENGQPPIVLLGHMDTVRGVVPVRIEDGRLYGRGAVDARGPLAAFLCAAAQVNRQGGLIRPIVVIGAVEEEAATSRGARAVVGRYQPAACVIGEPSGSSAITLGYKGRLLVEGVVSREISHTAGPDRSSSELAAEFWERVRVYTATWNQEHNPGNSAFASLQPSLRTINSQQDGLIEHTDFTVAYRLPLEFPTAELRNLLTIWAQELDITLRFRGEERAYQSTRTTPLARAFGSALRASGVTPVYKVKTGTADMNVVGPIWGENIVAYGPGDSRLDHTPNEHIEINEYLHAIDVLASVLRQLSTDNAQR